MRNSILLVAVAIGFSLLGTVYCADANHAAESVVYKWLYSSATPLDIAEIAQSHQSDTPVKASDTHSSPKQWKRGTLMAGVSEIDITPPLGCPMAGYARYAIFNPPNEVDDPYDYATWFYPAVGTHDRLKAQALVLDDGANRICLLAMDSAGVTSDFFEALVQRVEDIGFSYENVMMFGSHTHSGPGAVALEPFWWFWGADLFKEELQDYMVDLIEAAIRQAQASLVPAAIGFGEVDVPGILVNRRELPDIDSMVRVIRVDSVETGEHIAVLADYALHPIAAGLENNLFSADIPGGVRSALKQQLGEAVIAMYANGVQGDITQNESGWAAIDGVGTAIAQAVIDLLPSITTESEVTLSFAAQLVSLPAPYIRPGLMIPDYPLDETISLDGLLYAEALFQAFKINDKIITSFPGEPITYIGRIIQQGVSDLGFGMPVIISCANHHKGYVVTAEEYWRGGYESLACFFGPEAELLFTDGVLTTVAMLTE